MKSIFTISFLLTFLANAEVKIADVFSDHAVLQRGTAVPVWGTAKAGAEVTVTFGKQSLTTTADKDGQWSLKLRPLIASYDPQDLTASSNNSVVILTDIVVGEVWICSGQSNMAWSAKNIPEIDALLKGAKHIRSYEVPRTVAFTEQESIPGGKWKTTTPKSAVGGSFAYFLQQHADTPIGIIHASWGSSGIEAWMPRDMVNTVPHFKTIIEEFDRNKESQKEIQRILDGKRPFPGKDDVFLRRQSNILYNAMIHPVAPYACRGLVWYGDAPWLL